MFGTRRVEPWRPLLDRVLRDDPRFVRADGGWTLASARPAELAARRDVVAVALATTGADPRRHRIVRLAAARAVDGIVSGRLDLALNPGRPLPGYVSAAVRLSQEEADEAPCFSQVAEAFREFVGDSPIIGYGVRWIGDFLTAELARAGTPRLSNPLVELDELGRSVGAGGRKPSLRSLAEQLGISHPRPNHPPADADVAARVGWALLAPAGIEQLGQTAAGRAPLPARAVDERGPRALRDRRWLVDIPDGPGVYTIVDADDVVLYVGKAAQLRRRLAAYVGRAFALHRQLEGLAARAAAVRVEVTPSDLEARLLEARLIRYHQPPFNVQRSSRPRSVLIRASAGAASPRLQLARQVEADGSQYLGPFPSERAARSALALARAVYPAACARRAVDPDARRRSVQRAVRLLTGHRDDAMAELRVRMRDSGRRADHLGVDRTRRLLRQVLDFELRPSPLLGIPWDEEILVVEPVGAEGGRRAHLIRAGRLLASTSLPASVDLIDPDRALAVVAELLAVPAAPQDEAEVAIVLQWLGERAPGREIRPVSHLRRAADGSSGWC